MDADAQAAARRVWEAGDYPAVARTHAEAGEATVRRAAIGAGDRVLDVAAGDGNVAIPAALAGGDVVALDLTPALLAAGRERAARAGVEIEWAEGDAEDLPHGDGAFDAVLSNFGAIFAPDHERAAAELVRVCRPGGVIAVTAWDREGFNGVVRDVLSSVLPGPAPDPDRAPIPWGVPDHARACFKAAGVHELRVQSDMVSVPFADAEAAREFFSASFGPLVLMRAQLEAEGRWPTVEEALLDHTRRGARPAAGGDGIVIDQAYFTYLARRPAT